MGKGFEFKEIDRGWSKLKGALSSLRSGESYVKAGVFGVAGSKRRASAEDFESRAAGGKLKHNTGISNVELATIHEFGAPSAGVPERSFIRSSFEKNRAAYEAALKTLMARVYSNELTIPKALRILGLKMSADMKKGITENAGIPPPNAPSTIEKKGSSRPLVDTGRLVGSITSAVVIQGSEDAE